MILRHATQLQEDKDREPRNRSGRREHRRRVVRNHSAARLRRRRPFPIHAEAAKRSPCRAVSRSSQASLLPRPARGFGVALWLLYNHPITGARSQIVAFFEG